MPPGDFFVFFGLIATGKSTLAAAWAERHGLAYYNSDVVRKELAGAQVETAGKTGWTEGIYTREFSRRTYDALLNCAEKELVSGAGVVLDGSYHLQEERERVQDFAGRLGAQVIFVLCFCSDDLVRRRLAKRANDPAAVSDGRWEIYLRQKERFEDLLDREREHCIYLETDMQVEDLLNTLERRLKE